MHSGTYAEIWAGTVLAVAGLAWTIVRLRACRGIRERAYLRRVVLIAWIAVPALVGAICAVPRPFGFLLWIPFVLVSWPTVIRWTRTLEEIRRQESGDTD